MPDNLFPRPDHDFPDSGRSERDAHRPPPLHDNRSLGEWLEPAPTDTEWLETESLTHDQDRFLVVLSAVIVALGATAAFALIGVIIWGVIRIVGALT